MHIPKHDPLGVYRPWFPSFQNFNDPDYDPSLALDEVFEAYSLEDLRRYSWRMYKAALQNEEEYETGRDRNNLTYFFERINDLFNASYLIALDAWLKKKAREQTMKKE